MAYKPPLDLSVEVTQPNGSRYRWDSDAHAAGDVPTGITFRTKRGDGFADGGLTLSRRIDRDYPDVNLLDDFALIGYDGSVAYEGRVAANPRSFGQSSHQITVVTQGHMNHARDRKFVMPFVDRDFASWTQMPINRRAALAATVPIDSDYTFQASQGGLTFQGQDAKAITSGSLTEAWYTMPPGIGITKIMYYGSGSNTANVVAATLKTDDNDALSSPTSTSVTLNSTLQTTTPATAERYGALSLAAASTHTQAAGAPTQRIFNSLAVYGNHGLTTHAIDTTTPDGLYASDVITWIVQQFCPRLSTSGVQATTYAIPHLNFAAPVDPYDAFLECNKYHLWSLSVWEDKTLTFAPYDLTDYDWEVRLSDPGVTVDLQGDSVDQFANGICVNFTDVVTGQPNRITPDDDTTLADLSVTNPANTHGYTLWTETTLSSPTTSAAAAQIGRAVLAEFNQPKAPGTIKITGHVRDRAGHWQPVWKMRADQRVAITDHPDDRPRLIVESEYSHDTKTVTIGVDASLMRIGAVLDRTVTALKAANLT